MKLEFHGWQFLADPNRTRAAYAASSSLGARECSCAYCQNWVAQREAETPRELLAFLESAGVDPAKEAEVWEAGPLKDDLSYNAGWWHFVAEVKRKGSEVIALESSPGGQAREWKMWFQPGGRALKLESLPDSPLVQVEFEVQLPWVLSESYPTS